MLRGVGIAAAQLLAQGLHLKVLAANLSEVDTPGFRQDRTSEQSFKSLLLDRIDAQNQSVGSLDLGPVVSRPSIDLSPGPADPTGRPLDVTISGDGFFVVQSPDGLQYTRRGAFHQDGKGQLVSLEGWPVLGQNGPISAGSALSIGPAGDVVANGRTLDRLQVATFPAGTSFNRRAGTYLVPDNGATSSPAKGSTLLAGNLEGSNVDLATTMTDILTATRSYQASQRALVAEDSTLGQLIQQVNAR